MNMPLKMYELSRLGLELFLPPLYRQVRLGLEKEVRRFGSPPRLLDVGGRKSPYTIGIRGDVTILDLPRESELQEELGLGINDEVIAQTQRRRSNIRSVRIGDMTRSGLRSESFDIVVAVEVLEHVEEDNRFVSEVSRVLKPEGSFLMTTPNGDWVENKNPDHKRHYLKMQLSGLLEKHFEDVTAKYAIAGGRFRKMGLRPWSVRRPVRTLGSIFGNAVNTVQSSNGGIGERKEDTHHLFAVARKPRRRSEGNGR